MMCKALIVNQLFLGAKARRDSDKHAIQFEGPKARSESIP